MRLAVIAPSLELGGAERSLVKLLQTVESDQVRVVLILLTGADNTLLKELPKQTEVHCLRGRTSRSPLLWVQVYKLLWKVRPDTVLGWSTYANLLAVLATRFLPGCWLVVSERNYIPRAFAKGRVRAGWRYLILRLIRSSYRRANVVTANSTANLRFLQRFIGSGPEYRLLPNVIDVRSADVQAAASDLEELPNWIGPRFLALGRLVPQKGFDLLLQSFAAIRGSYPWSLLVVGDGPECGNLRTQAKALGVDHYVHWAGRASNPYPFYRWADVVIVPSRFEGFPNVPLEAMALAKPVVVSDCKTGPSELTQGGRFGVLVPVGDISALTKAIVELGNDPERRRDLGRSAREHILRSYGVGTMRVLYTSVLRIK